MSTRFLEILSVQRPFAYGTDSANRVLFSCNYNAIAAAPVNNWELSIIELLHAATPTPLATSAVDAFVGPEAAIPPGDGPYISVVDTSGMQPEENHNSSDSKYERLSIQVIVRAADYSIALVRSLAIWRLLDGYRRVTTAA